MRLTWRRSVRAEDRFKTWLAEQRQKQVLESGVTAPGPCPDEPRSSSWQVTTRVSKPASHWAMRLRIAISSVATAGSRSNSSSLTTWAFAY
jgi:hypothetical protein